MQTNLRWLRIELVMILVMAIMSFGAIAKEDVSNPDPSRLVARWKDVGFKVELPWRKSRSPGKDYTYIAQCRAHVGAPGPSGFKTEITCEILGRERSKAHTILVGLEIWNKDSERDGRFMVIKAIETIGVDVPDEVIRAFVDAKEVSVGEWRVVDESTKKLKEIRVYYHPGGKP